MSKLEEADPHSVEGSGPGRTITRRRFLAAIAGLAGAGGLSYVLVRGLGARGSFEDGTSAAREGSPFDDFARNVTSGGPPKDGIPAIDEPRFVPARDAGFLSDPDVVFGLVHGGEARAYPQLILVWHEIVNDLFPDGPLSITYCPLTGSVVAFRGVAPGGEPYTFGTSGDLVNSNLLMYDRQTDSRWPQILAQAILGSSRGGTLEEVPLDWTTWGRWRKAHPDTLVLSTDTGYIRAYGNDPYGSYTPLGGYYAEGSTRFFPVMHEDPRFDDKEVFIGAKLGAARAAVRKGLLRERTSVTVTMGADAVAFLYDPDLDEGRAYISGVDGRELRLSPAERSGQYEDHATGSTWDASGSAISGPLAGAALRRIVSYDVMWFAWVAFFPRTEVVG